MRLGEAAAAAVVGERNSISEAQVQLIALCCVVPRRVRALTRPVSDSVCSVLHAVPRCVVSSEPTARDPPSSDIYIYVCLDATRALMEDFIQFGFAPRTPISN